MLFGILFAVTGRKLRPLPWYLWIVFRNHSDWGWMGDLNCPSLLQGYLPDWLLILEREKYALFLRTLTGGLFGITTAWYLYPLIEETMQETRRVLVRKKAVVEQV